MALEGTFAATDMSAVDEGVVDTSSTGSVSESQTLEIVDDAVVSTSENGQEIIAESSEWIFDIRDGLADDVAQAVSEISDAQFRINFLLPVILASIGAAYLGIWVGDKFPGGRTTVGKATGAVLGTLLIDVIARKVRER